MVVRSVLEHSNLVTSDNKRTVVLVSYSQLRILIAVLWSGFYIVFGLIRVVVLAALIVRVLWRDRAESAGLLLDGGHHPGVLVADVGVDELGGQVEQPAAVAVPDVARMTGARIWHLAFRLINLNPGE